MRYGRINERNTGSWSLAGEPKTRQSKDNSLRILSSKEELAYKAVLLIDDLLKSHSGGYYSYISWDLDSPLIEHWKKNGIVFKGIRKADSRFGGLDKEICHLNTESISDLKLTRGLLIQLNNLHEHIKK